MGSLSKGKAQGEGVEDCLSPRAFWGVILETYIYVYLQLFMNGVLSRERDREGLEDPTCHLVTENGCQGSGIMKEFSYALNSVVGMSHC